MSEPIEIQIDPYSDPEYQALVSELAKECRCSSKPCDGLLAGGFCDGLSLDDGWDNDDPHL